MSKYPHHLSLHRETLVQRFIEYMRHYKLDRPPWSARQLELLQNDARLWFDEANALERESIGTPGALLAEVLRRLER